MNRFVIGFKRPLLLAFFLGCTVSFLTNRALTLRLVFPAMIYWSFVPLIEIATLAAICSRNRDKIPLSVLIDSFFRGFRPWLLWLVGMCAIWSLLSPATRSIDWTVNTAWLIGGVVVAVIWSLYIDFAFFQSVLRRSRATAFRELALQRLISWSLILGIIGAPTIWSDITGRLW
jgi:hypothetical protein